MQRSYLLVAIAVSALLVGRGHASTILDSATWHGHTYYVVQFYANWCSGEPNDAWIPAREQHLALDFGGSCWNDEGSAVAAVSGYVAETFGPTVESFVAGFYTDVLGREASAAEIRSWVGYLTANPTAAAVTAMAHTFLDGPEFLGRPGTQARYVTLLYELFLGRTPGASERDGWVGALQAGFDSALPGFVASPEFASLLPDPRNPAAVEAIVSRLYVHVLGRSPAPAEAAAWTGYVVATGDVLGAATGFFDSAEYTSAPRTLAEHVRTLYRTFLGREPAPAEIGPWTAYLQSFRTTVEDSFIASPEFRARLTALGLTGGSTPPSISNLVVNPPSVPRGAGEALVTGAVDFVEPDGDLAFVRLTVVVSGQTLDTPVSTAATSGRVLAQIRVNTSVPGTYAFTVQAFDRAGNASNQLTGFLTITP